MSGAVLAALKAAREFCRLHLGSHTLAAQLDAAIPQAEAGCELLAAAKVAFGTLQELMAGADNESADLCDSACQVLVVAIRKAEGGHGVWP